MPRTFPDRRSALAVFAGGIVVLAFPLFVRSGQAGPDGAPVISAEASPVIALRQLASGVGPITFIANAGDSRLFLTTQTGQVLIYEGAILPTPFLDVSGFVLSGGERGLLSVAFHPQYAQNGFLFVYYTNSAGNIEIVRYQRSMTNPDAADPSSRAVLLTIPHPINANHNGGQLQFGPDGYLYLGTGDGGSANDPPCNAQNDNSPLGKLLRIDVNQNVNTPPFYGIPPSNPQAAEPYPRNLTWAKGLRNPWRFSFDRSTSDLWIGDVGQSAWEEIDFQPRSSGGGQNYGWKIMEGNHCGGGDSSNCPTSPAPPPCNSPLFTYPVFEYDHSGGNCSVTGGYVYRGTLIPALGGTYVYGDYCSGVIWGNGQLLAPIAPGLTTFGEDAVGELYIGTGGGQLFGIVQAGAPTATATPTRTPTPSPPPPTATPTATPTPADARPALTHSRRHRPEPRPLPPR